MPEPDSIGGSILAATTFLAGLILAYIGNLSSGYGSYAPEQKAAVRKRFQRRARWAFAAFSLSVLAIGLDLASMWFDSGDLLIAAVVVLMAVLVGGVVSAFMLVRGIK